MLFVLDKRWLLNYVSIRKSFLHAWGVFHTREHAQDEGLNQAAYKIDSA